MILSVPITLSVIILSFSSVEHHAYAHISKTFGNFTVEVGWGNEPPLAGDMNTVTISVAKGPEGNSEPILNALGDVVSSIKYGTLTENLNFVPSETADGLYEAKVIPTRTGSSYALVLNGTIQGQAVSAEIPLDNVESKDKFSFPHNSSSEESSSSSGGGATMNLNMQKILSQISNTQQNTQAGMEQLANAVQNVTESVSSLKSYVDKTFFIAVSSVGVGLAGIIIAGFSLSRKTKIGSV
jgi:hypothetical protein